MNARRLAKGTVRIRLVGPGLNNLLDSFLVLNTSVILEDKKEISHNFIYNLGLPESSLPEVRKLMEEAENILGLCPTAFYRSQGNCFHGKIGPFLEYEK